MLRGPAEAGLILFQNCPTSRGWAWYGEGMNTNDKWTHKVTRTLPYKGGGYRDGTTITVEAGLHQLGDQSPYFSVTASIQEPRARDTAAGGCLHDDVARHWPELRPIIALHLSDEWGTPMYAAVNGLYHLGYGPFGTWKQDVAASHFRITETEAAELRERIASGSGHDGEKYAEEIKGMLPRWQDEAADALNILDRLAAV